LSTERISALSLVLQPLLWSDAQETAKSLRSPGQWEGGERDSHPKKKLYLKSQIRSVNCFNNVAPISIMFPFFILSII